MKLEEMLRQLEDDNKYINVCIDDYSYNCDYNADFDNTLETFNFITTTPELSLRELRMSRPKAVSLINEAIGWGWASHYNEEHNFDVTISIEECS